MRRFARFFDSDTRFSRDRRKNARWRRPGLLLEALDQRVLLSGTPLPMHAAVLSPAHVDTAARPTRPLLFQTAKTTPAVFDSAVPVAIPKPAYGPGHGMPGPTPPGPLPPVKVSEPLPVPLPNPPIKVGGPIPDPTPPDLGHLSSNSLTLSTASGHVASPNSFVLPYVVYGAGPGPGPIGAASGEVSRSILTPTHVASIKSVFPGAATETPYDVTCVINTIGRDTGIGFAVGVGVGAAKGALVGALAALPGAVPTAGAAPALGAAFGALVGALEGGFTGIVGGTIKGLIDAANCPAEQAPAAPSTPAPSAQPVPTQDAGVPNDPSNSAGQDGSSKATSPATPSADPSTPPPLKQQQPQDAADDTDRSTGQNGKNQCTPEDGKNQSTPEDGTGSASSDNQDSTTPDPNYTPADSQEDQSSNGDNNGSDGGACDSGGDEGSDRGEHIIPSGVHHLPQELPL
jgi:hypothetical protein